jgi:peptidoglycan glycosyltransferase
MDISAQIRRITVLFVALFMALSAGLVYWQVVVAQQVTANPHNSRPCLTTNAPVRGKILDRNGVVLAQNSAQPGPCGYVREYTDPTLAGLIGYYVPGYPPTGIEAAFNDYLSGQVGLTSLNNTMNHLLHQPPVGDNIYLTIDERIQKIVYNDFVNNTPPPDGVNVFKSDRGSVIVSDPHTGDILAMVSTPIFDPNKLVNTLTHGDLSYYNSLSSQATEQPLLERPLYGHYVPGSIYKTVTLLAALDSGSATLNTEFDRDHALGTNNAVVYDGQVFGPTGNNIQGYTIRFPVDTEYGYTHSDNIIFAQIGVKTGAATWLDYNKRFYVGQQIPFALPVAVSTVQQDNQALADNQLAAAAFGQGIDFVTPMQMSLINNIVANNGQLMQPQLLTKIVDSSNAPVQTYNAQPLGAQQVTAQTATEVRQAMYGVVRCGSGLVISNLFTNNAVQYGIIGKTGTGEVGNGQPAQAWMITEAPYSITNPTQLPALTITAMKENAGEGGSVVGPLIAHMYQDIFTQVMTNVPQTPPSDPAYCCQTGLLQIGCA